MGVTDTASADVEGQQRTVEYRELEEEVMELVSDRAVAVGTVAWTVLFFGGIGLFLLGHSVMGSVGWIFSSFAVFGPRVVASIRYVRGLSPASVWWLLCSDPNATLFFGAVVAPFATGLVMVGTFTAVQFGAVGVGIAVAVPGVVVGLLVVYLFAVHRVEMCRDFAAAVRVLWHVARR